MYRLDYVDREGRSSASLKGCQTRVGWGKPATVEQNASISETIGNTYKVTTCINDEVYPPNRQYRQYSYRQTQTDRQIQMLGTIRQINKKVIGSCICAFDWHQDR